MAYYDQTIGNLVGTSQSTFFVVNTGFYSNAGASTTPATNTEFQLFANAFIATDRGTALGTNFPGSGGTAAATSIQSVEG